MFNTKIFKINGMHCSACATMIDLDLEELPGVKSSKTNYAKQETTVEFDSVQVSPDRISTVIQQAGYQITSVT